MENKLSKYITDSRNSHETQHSFITMLEKFKSALDKVKNVCVLFMDVSKAFDTINQDLLLAKWKAYGFSKNALELICSRSSRSEMLLVKGVLKKCRKVTGEHPCQSVISIKLLFSFIEITLWDWYSPVICCIFSEHLFLKTPLGSCFWCSYLKNRNQLIQTNDNFSSSKKLHARVHKVR